MSDRGTIIIAGAGIAGLTAALMLSRIGYHVKVLEREAGIDEAGVGIQLSPNATRILSQLGLGGELKDAGVAPDALFIHDGKSGDILTRMPFGEAIAERHGAPYLVLHRADLAGLLLNACRHDNDVEILFGMQVEATDPSPDQISVSAVRNGEDFRYQGVALIGADGVGSRIRSQFMGGSSPVPSGDVAWRTLIPVARLPEGFNEISTHLWLGRGGHVVCYPVRNMDHLNIVAITPQSCATDITRRVPQADPSALNTFYEGWCTSVRMLLGLATQWSGWPLNEVDPSGPWTSGAAALIGDAAHAMLPYAAQGGAAAIEDAAVLAGAFQTVESDMAKAVALFEERRKPPGHRNMATGAPQPSHLSSGWHCRACAQPHHPPQHPGAPAPAVRLALRLAQLITGVQSQ